MVFNASLNIEDYIGSDDINNMPQMGLQNRIPNKAMHPCFQIPNALSALQKKSSQLKLPKMTWLNQTPTAALYYYNGVSQTSITNVSWNIPAFADEAFLVYTSLVTNKIWT